MLVKQEGRGYNQVTRTINPSTVLSLPEGGTYIIEVRSLSEGGEGAASAQIRLVTSSGKLTASSLPSPSIPHSTAWPLKPNLQAVLLHKVATSVAWANISLVNAALITSPTQTFLQPINFFRKKDDQAVYDPASAEEAS